MTKAEKTRFSILEKAFELIYVKGYQATSIDDILANIQVTKGAFYYHFKNKDEMGLAIVNEIMKPNFQNSFTEALQTESDPLQSIYDLMHYLLLGNKFLSVQSGCPASNFTQEMAPWNVDFSKALNELTQQWNKTIITALEKGKKEGFVRADVNARQATLFILSGYWGVRNFGKLANDTTAYKNWLKELKNYLATLK
jgi:TetR/AcrR family transcriptional regulator, transcriptional repressor for nem operon